MLYVKDIVQMLDATVLYSEDMDTAQVQSVCGSDMMSDVLAYVKDQAVLLTGLVNPQVVRTAEMMDMVCIVFVRSKQPTEAILTLARNSGIVVLATDMRLYEACGRLYSNGLQKDEVKEDV